MSKIIRRQKPTPKPTPICLPKIQSMRVRNYQVHEDSLMVFSPGVNVIKGDSRAGKSSLIRAFRWGSKNRPLGDMFISHFAGPSDVTDVSLVTTEGTFVTRGLHKGKGYYDIGDIRAPNDATNLKALRSDVPEEVIRLLDMSNLNLHTQHEGFFLLSDTPGDVARKLNEYVGLSIINDLPKMAKNDVSKTDSLILFHEKELSNKHREMSESEWAESAFEDLNTMIAIDNRAETLVLKQDDLESQLYDINELDRKLSTIEKSLEQEEVVQKLSADFENLLYLSNMLISRESYFADVLRIDEAIELIGDVTEEEAAASSMLADLSKLDKLDSDAIKLRSALDGVNRCDTAIGIATDTITKLERKLADLWNSIRVCPLCKQPLKRIMK